MYSDKVRQLIRDLPHMGPLPDATHSAEVSNPVCGDTVRLHLKTVDGRLEACRFQAYGCPAAIAAAAAVAELLLAGTREHWQELDAETVVAYLGGLPAHKRHGAELAVEALRQACARPRKERGGCEGRAAASPRPAR